MANTVEDRAPLLILASLSFSSTNHLEPSQLTTPASHNPAKTPPIPSSHATPFTFTATGFQFPRQLSGSNPFPPNSSPTHLLLPSPSSTLTPLFTPPPFTLFSSGSGVGSGLTGTNSLVSLTQFSTFPLSSNNFFFSSPNSLLALSTSPLASVSKPFRELTSFNNNPFNSFKRVSLLSLSLYSSNCANPELTFSTDQPNSAPLSCAFFNSTAREAIVKRKVSF
ncbi:hypothetical protein HOY82DRAFT_539250 [Tuber indicum]|nr:hypothetical protein HOY82DRAFT_539250 [Tuber indicum]